jgi:transketolase
MSRRTRLLVSLLAATTILAGWLALSPHPAAAIGTADLAITMVGDKKAPQVWRHDHLHRDRDEPWP